MRPHRFSLLTILCAILLLPIQQLIAQENTTKTGTDLAKKVASDSEANSQATDDRESKLAQYLSGSIFAGQFTVDGKPSLSPKAEEYTIAKCEKLDAPDLYRLTARIKYGQVDSEVPMDIKILWSGNTPVITLDSLWIPGMGTFSARVLIHSNRYAGTWQHDAVGGHMFGMIRKAASSESKSSEKTP